MIKKKYMSQCISSDYCQGWNDAVAEAKVVHCKECEWWDRDLECVKDIGDHAGVCMLAKWFCGENGFCLYGKKAE